MAPLRDRRLADRMELVLRDERLAVVPARGEGGGEGEDEGEGEGEDEPRGCTW